MPRRVNVGGDRDDDHPVGLLLAAGFGRRFGADKRFHRLDDGRPMAVAAAEQLRAVCPRVWAVVRADDEALAALIESCGCAVVRSAEAARGMGHSLAAGVGATLDAPGWLVALADMPYIRRDSYQAVIAAFCAGASLARPAYRGAPGHPVCFAASWRDALLALAGDLGARDVLRQGGKACRVIEVDDAGVIVDVDALPASAATSAGR